MARFLSTQRNTRQFDGVSSTEVIASTNFHKNGIAVILQGANVWPWQKKSLECSFSFEIGTKYYAFDWTVRNELSPTIFAI